MADEPLREKYEDWLNFHDRQMLRTKYGPGSENSAPGVGEFEEYKSAEEWLQIARALINHVSMLTGVLEHVVLDLANEVQRLKDSTEGNGGSQEN